MAAGDQSILPSFVSSHSQSHDPSDASPPLKISVLHLLLSFLKFADLSPPSAIKFFSPLDYLLSINYPCIQRASSNPSRTPFTSFRSSLSSALSSSGSSPIQSTSFVGPCLFLLLISRRLKSS